MTTLNLSKGHRGEALASDHLLKKGLKIIEKNWRCRWGEIDLIAQDGNKLVFIEVKTRQGSEFGNGFEAVTSSKQKKILRTALSYLQSKKKKMDFAFGVLSIALKDTQNTIEYIEFPLDGFGRYY